jgi:hypothetical protein
MTTLKKYLLCLLMLNATIVTTMNACLNDVGIILEEMREQQLEEDKNDDFSQYVFEKELIEAIHRRIDLRHLNVSKYDFGKSLIGLLVSYYKTINISPEKATEELNTILSYIPTHCTQHTENIVRKLIKKHAYVNFLVHVLMQEEFQKFDEVKGSTIDQLFNPGTTNDTSVIQEIVSEDARKFFFNNFKNNNELELPHRDFADIHFTVFYGHTNKIDPYSLQISSPSTYLRAKDKTGNKIIWLIATGEQVELSKESSKQIQWASAEIPAYMQPCAVDTKNKYYATACATWFTHLVKVKKDKPAVVVYQHPKKISYLAQRAYENSQNNRDELIALQNSQTVKAIEGCPGKNLENLIKERIDLLQ